MTSTMKKTKFESKHVAHCLFPEECHSFQHCSLVRDTFGTLCSRFSFIAVLGSERVATPFALRSPTEVKQELGFQLDVQ